MPAEKGKKKAEINIGKVAEIARLELTEEEKKQFSRDLEDVLEAFEVMDKFADSTLHRTKPSFQPFDVKDVTRDDKPEECIERKDALRNTEHKERGYFKGPKSV